MTNFRNEFYFSAHCRDVSGEVMPLEKGLLSTEAKWTFLRVPFNEEDRIRRLVNVVPLKFTVRYFILESEYCEISEEDLDIFIIAPRGSAASYHLPRQIFSTWVISNNEHPFCDGDANGLFMKYFAEKS